MENINPGIMYKLINWGEDGVWMKMIKMENN